MTATYEDFQKLDLRVGTIVQVDEFPEARNPAYRVIVDFGPELGTRKSCAQLTCYERASLVGRQVICVVNLPPRQIGPARSEVLILGAKTDGHGTAILAPEKESILGSRVF